MDCRRQDYADYRSPNSKAKDMKFAKLFFPGNFEDAYVYMGWLNCFTTERDLRMFNLERVSQQVAQRVPEAAGVVQHCFARNDWVSSEQFRTLMKDQSFRADFLSAVDRLPEPFEVNAEEGPMIRDFA